MANAETSYFAHPTAVIDQPCTIGAGTKVWHFSHVMADVQIGENCSLGQNVHVAPSVIIGDRVKIQNNVSLYTGCEIESDVFLGPSCVFTNISNPRSEVKRHHLYEKTLVKRGATIGANATIVCGVTLGNYAFIAAGAVVTKDVPDFALIQGVPGRVSGWMSRHGYRLGEPDAQGIMICPETGMRYQLSPEGTVRCLDEDEHERLAG